MTRRGRKLYYQIARDYGLKAEPWRKLRRDVRAEYDEMARAQRGDGWWLFRGWCLVFVFPISGSFAVLYLLKEAV